MWSDAAPVGQLMRRASKKAKMTAMPTGKMVTGAKALALFTLVLGCSSSGKPLTGTGTGGQGGGGNSPTTTETLTISQTAKPAADILFVVYDSDTEIQAKLLLQIPTFIQVLKGSTSPLDLHIAVVTADMGAPGDVMTEIRCTAQGDGGLFQSTPRGTCTDTTLMNGATYLSDDGNGATNFTGSMATVLQCISDVGDAGCGFFQPLAAAAHALGADNLVNGTPTPPATNAGFLRPDAALAVIVLGDQDDCSPPAGTELFSLDGGQQDLSNPLGPLAHYRCNQYGHLCKDPASSDPNALIMPPLNPPSDAQGTASTPTLNLTDCQDNDTSTGLLTPVTKFVADIKALKQNPDGQIMVAAISAPPTPYAVAWVPEEGGTQAGELWPEVEHSCGAAGTDDVNPAETMNPTDGSFGDPGVRLAAFVGGFQQSVLASICDASYAQSMTAIATKIGQLGLGNCLTGTIQMTASALPTCTVTAQVPDSTGATKSVSYQNCVANGNTPPCWTLTIGTGSCVGESVQVVEASGAESSSLSVSCQICKPGVTVSGC